MIEVEAKPGFTTNLHKYLYDAMKDRKFIDVTFAVGNRSFFAHLVVLSACSEFFVENRYKLSAVFSEYNHTVIEAILKYCYTGKTNIENKHFKNFMKLAEKIQIKSIAPQFETIDATNCVKVLGLSEDPKSREKATSLTIDNFNTLYKNQEIVNLPVSSLADILKSDKLNVSAEELFESVKLWVKSDETNRNSDLVDLLSLVKLPSVTMEFLVKDVLVFCSPYEECIGILQQAIESIFLNSQSKLSVAEQNFENSQSKLSISEQNLKNLQSKLSTSEQNFENSQSKLSVANQNLKDCQSKLSMAKLKFNHFEFDKIALIGDYSIEANTIDVYDGRKNTWTLSKNFDFDRNEFASVLVNEEIMIIGGWKSSSKVDSIDLKDGKKHSLKPLNEGRTYLSAVTLRHPTSTDVYVIGGYVDSRFSSVERWNSKTMNWDKNVAPLLIAVYHHSASVIDDRIYVAGGRTIENGNNISINMLQVYSVDSNSWSYSTPMMQAREQHSSTVNNGMVYVGGGYIYQTTTYLDSVESYDPKKKLWTAFCTLPTPARRISLCFFQNKLLSMEGHDGNRRLRNVWEYDDVSKHWKALPSLNEGRYAANAIVLPSNSTI
ncbi:kelch-like protein 23 [Arctopsyche grandis]|uniref:kelch-like protein 23 n=1 Tax=Arctopsyche grandis TaxID=121162 RepID=UPI00406D8E40